jgi:hypothetical protein
MSKSKWTRVGEIGVDAGLCWVGDPCYVLHKEATAPDLGPDWMGFCDRLAVRERNGAAQWHYRDGAGGGLGVSVSTGYGDGSYPVYVRHNEEGRVAEVRVVFIPKNR